MMFRPDLNGVVLQLPTNIVAYQLVNGSRRPLPDPPTFNLLFLPGAKIFSPANPDEPTTAVRWSLSTD